MVEHRINQTNPLVISHTRFWVNHNCFKPKQLKGKARWQGSMPHCHINYHPKWMNALMLNKINKWKKELTV